MKILKHLFIVLLGIYCINLNAQNNFVIKNFTTVDGLPVNNVKNIKKDKNGFFWILTNAGLARYDGKKIEKKKTFDRTNEIIPYIFDAKTSINHDLFYYCGTKTVLFIDDNSRIKKFNDSLFFGIRSQIGDELFLSFKVSDLVKKNSSQHVRSFIESYEKDSIYSAFQESEHSFYFHSNKGFFYGDKNGIQLLKSNNIFSWPVIISNHFVLIYKNGYYEVYKYGKCIYKGINKVIGYNSYAYSYEGYFDYFNTQKSTYTYLHDTVYQISLNNKNQIQAKPYVYNLKKSLGIYVDDENKCYFSYNLNEGFYSSKEKDFKLIENKEKRNTLYSHIILPHNKIITTSETTKAFTLNQTIKHGYEFSGPICAISSSQFIAGNIKTIGLFNLSGNIVKNFSFKSIGVKQFLKTDSTIYIIGKKISKYNTKSQTINYDFCRDWFSNSQNIFAACLTNIPNTIMVVNNDSLYHLNLKQKKYELIISNLPKNIRSIFFDSSLNATFISTQGSGLFIYYQNKIITLPLDVDKSLLYNHYVLADNDGDYWLPTNNGLYCLFKKDLLNYLEKKIPINYKRFSKDDGLDNDEFNGGFSNSGILYKDSISLVSMGGIVQFHPSIKNKVTKETGKLVIDYVIIDSLNIDYNNQLLLLEPNFKHIEIKAAFPFINTNGNLEYRLLGGNDTNWHTLYDANIISIRNMPSGTYSIQIRPSTCLTAVKTINLLVKPYWYNTWWATLVFAIIICLVAYIVYRWQLFKQKNKQLLQLHKSRNKLLTIITHDLKSPINNFIGLADTMQFLIAQKDFDTIKKIGEEMDDKSRNLQLLMSNIFTYSLSENEYLKASNSKFFLADLLVEILPAYRDMALNKHITLKEVETENTAIISDKNLLSLVIRNILDNGIKYAKEHTEVSMEINITSKILAVKITSCTSQEHSTQVSKISHLLRSKLNIEPFEDGFGLGVVTAIKALNALKGEMQVELKENSYCIFILKVPCE